MDRVAVVTLLTGTAWAALAEITLPTQREYARRINADFVVLNKSVYAHPHYDKWQIHDLFNEYDRIVYIDADMIVRHDCPDLFLMVPPEFVAGENELLSFPGQAQHLARFIQLMGLPPIGCPFYVNGGLFVASRAHRGIFRPPEKVLADIPWPEQNHLNYRLIGENARVCLLPPAFNDRHRQGNYLRGSFILHYSVIPLDAKISSAQRDLAAWNVLGRRG